MVVCIALHIGEIGSQLHALHMFYKPVFVFAYSNKSFSNCNLFLRQCLVEVGHTKQYWWRINIFIFIFTNLKYLIYKFNAYVLTHKLQVIILPTRVVPTTCHCPNQFIAYSNKNSTEKQITLIVRLNLWWLLLLCQIYYELTLKSLLRWRHFILVCFCPSLYIVFCLVLVITWLWKMSVAEKI